MEDFIMKKSILMLTALFMLGACSTTGNDDDTSSTPSTDDKVKSALAGQASAGVTSAEDVTTAKEFYVSKDGVTLTYIPTGKTEAVEYTYKSGDIVEGEYYGYYADAEDDYVYVALNEEGDAYEVTELGTMDELFLAAVGGVDSVPTGDLEVNAKYFTFESDGSAVTIYTATSTSDKGEGVKYDFVDDSASLNFSSMTGSAKYSNTADNVTTTIDVVVKASGEIVVDGISYTPEPSL